MSRNYMIVDGNSLGHFAQNGAKLSIGDLPVQAIYNFLRSLRSQMALFSTYTPIVVWDGVSWRKQLAGSYKANRDKVDTKHDVFLQEQKNEYKDQIPYIKKALRLLGVAQAFSLNMEADDLAAIFTDKFLKLGGRVQLLTGDKDWLQLVGPGVTWRDFINKRVVNEASFEEMTGVVNPHQFVQMKALSGDTGDNVPGVGGIGEKGAIEFLKEYGTFERFLEMVMIEKSVDFKKLPKKIRALVENEEKALTFSLNMKLMDLRTPARPEPVALQIDKGEPDLDKFRRFCELLLFKSILQELNDWVRVFPHFNSLEQVS